MRIPYGFILTSDGVLKINKDEADVIITVLIEYPAFGLLGGAKLFGQLIALGYENVRINTAAFFQRGQQLILTGKFRYLFV